jgi:hypothetical protein
MSKVMKFSTMTMMTTSLWKGRSEMSPTIDAGSLSRQSSFRVLFF